MTHNNFIKTTTAANYIKEALAVINNNRGKILDIIFADSHIIIFYEVSN